MSEALSLKHWRQMFKSYFLIKPEWEEQTRHCLEPLPKFLGWENQTDSWAIMLKLVSILFISSCYPREYRSIYVLNILLHFHPNWHRPLFINIAPNVFSAFLHPYPSLYSLLIPLANTQTIRLPYQHQIFNITYPQTQYIYSTFINQFPELFYNPFQIFQNFSSPCQIYNLHDWSSIQSPTLLNKLLSFTIPCCICTYYFVI